jgi:acetyl esterase/lipase
MQRRESAKSSREEPGLRSSGANPRSRAHRTALVGLCLLGAALLASASAGQEATKSRPEDAPTSPVPQTVSLWPGVAPGSEQWKQAETRLGPTVVNVSTPTLTVYQPAASTATSTAVIIAPGGGFVGLSIDSEGHDVAKWLVARGITAIVLKYRTVQLEGHDAAQLGQSAGARFRAQLGNYALIDEDGKYGIADGIQAVKVVRAHAAEWGLSPDRIVFTGFSAGGMVTVFAALQPDARPNYAAPIYGAPISTVPKVPPQGLPPFFMAMAQDDTLAGPMIVALYDAVKAAGYKPEFHIFSSGGHGWGMRKQGKTSDHWIDEFYWWLEAQGLTRPAK